MIFLPTPDSAWPKLNKFFPTFGLFFSEICRLFRCYALLIISVFMPTNGNQKTC